MSKHAIKPPIAARFAVVLYPGEDREELWSWHTTLGAAQVCAAQLRDGETTADVMRVVHATMTEPAHLSTEF